MNSASSRAPQWGQGISSMASVISRRRPGATLVDGMSSGEPLQREAFVQRMRTILSNGVGENPAGTGCRLEAAIAPAGIEIEIIDGRLADDRATVHRHVHDAGPFAHLPHASEGGEE